MKLKAKYEIAKQAKVGDEVNCPSCNTAFTKTHYAQAFCKSRGGTKCKDKYWNTVTPEKRNNTTRISPANQAWVDHMNRVKHVATDFDYDGTWDAHQCYVEPCEFCGGQDCNCQY